MQRTTNSKSTTNNIIHDSFLAEKIELLIQKKYNITIPALLVEYLAIENVDFEVNDLKTFYTKFGDVVDFALKGKLSIVLYNTFFAAESCKEFLFNENNFKENMKQNFLVRWFDYEKDMGYLPSEMENLFETIHNRNMHNIQDNNKQNMINMMSTNINRLNNSNNGNNISNLNQTKIIKIKLI